MVMLLEKRRPGLQVVLGGDSDGYARTEASPRFTSCWGETVMVMLLEKRRPGLPVVLGGDSDCYARTEALPRFTRRVGWRQ